jgi:hypothetical protein
MLGIEKKFEKSFQSTCICENYIIIFAKNISNMISTKLLFRDEETVLISTLKKGEYFRRVNGKKVYVYEGKCRVYDKWGAYKGWGFEFTPVDDIWGGSMSTKKDIAVEVGFDY